jgi:hypothetical protein
MVSHPKEVVELITLGSPKGIYFDAEMGDALTKI